MAASVATGWVTWYRLRNGGDGRRPSGVGKTLTSRAHYTRDGLMSLCGRETGLYVKPVEVRGPAPKCSACARVLNHL